MKDQRIRLQSLIDIKRTIDSDFYSSTNENVDSYLDKVSALLSRAIIELEKEQKRNARS